MKTANDTTQVNLMRRQGILLRAQDKEKAINILKESVERAKKIGFAQGEIKGLYSLGLTHGMTGSYAESLDYLNQCLELSKENRDFERMNHIYKSMGIVYKRIGDYTKSQNFYLKSIALVDSLELNQNNSSVYINLGILYDLMDQKEKAVESYEKALETYKSSDFKSLEHSVMVNLAVIDYDDGNHEAALEKFLKAQSFLEERKKNIELCTNYSNIANCYLNLKKWKLAEENFLKSLELATKLSIKQQVAVANYGLADLMLRQGKLNQAMAFSNQNLEALSEIGGYKHLRDAHQKAYEIYNAKRQYPDAIKHLNQSMAYNDSLLNETKIREIQNLQVQHDVYLKDNEIKENNLQLALLNTRVELNKRRMTYLAIITILLMFSASLLYFRYRGKQRSNAILREKNLLISEQNETIEEMNKELEKRMLRAQMNPHFIFNSLNSIQYLINTDDKKNALKYLSKFSKLMRQVLESSVNISLPLKDEIELLKIYIELENLRFDNSFSYSLHVDENLDIHTYEIPMLLVQPYIENAIIHGLMPKKGEKKLHVSFEETNENIVCTIEDNGVGIDAQTSGKTFKRPSRGMSITAKRINALKKFSNQELVTVESSEKGTKVTILIPKD
nr:tetratricopeptide repeat protein [uncultured Allomuricauda sp.]